MTDVTARLHGGNEFSTAAEKSLTNKAAIRAKVLHLIAAAGDDGLTSDEAETVTGWPHQTVSARFSELKRDDAIRQSGRRPTRSGRTAAVYVAVPVQQTLFGATG